ncbi:MAG: AAA family ATPase [Planctomycetaceae bacterium]|nr:AAA family ATPase [Planctomycetaceae bacterium]MCB9949974.1 AAA family ATPase [Planctomycetaceae bacterium]
MFSETSSALGLRDKLSQDVRDVADALRDAFPTNVVIEQKSWQVFPCHWEGNRPNETPAGHVPGELREELNKTATGDSRRTHLADIQEALNRQQNRYGEVRGHANIRQQISPPPFVRVYIPSLRGLRASKNHPDFYVSRTVKDYFSSAGGINTWEGPEKIQDGSALNILTGCEMYSIVRSHLLGPRELRERITAFQRFVGDTFYDGQEFTLIPKEDSDVLDVKIGREAELPVHKLGDGIQHLLIMTLPLFIHRDKPLLLFIEEPELYLHPGYQRILIDTILKEQDRSLQVFVATHSHQFLDITIDSEQCSVYKFTKTVKGQGHELTAKFKVELTSNADFSVLQELGVRNSSVLLSNCTIWVEGITDRLYLRHYLDIYQQTRREQAKSIAEFREDLHYSFVEYGGGCVTHWSFLDEDGIQVERLCSKLFLVADSDEGKEERHEQLEKALGDRFYKLACREIENLLKPDAITKVIRDYEKDESLKLRTFKEEDYASELLGHFIQNHVLPDDGKFISKRVRKKTNQPYAAESGTLKNKPDFCTKALAHIKTREDISDEAWELCEKLYEFISKSNK